MGNFPILFLLFGQSNDMKKDKNEMNDELRSEYDLKSLKVRRFGSKRRKFGSTIIRLEPDVAEFFSTAEAVNEALRLFIRSNAGK